MAARVPRIAIRTSTATVAAISVVSVAACAVVTRDASLTGVVAGFAGTALGILAQRHTAADLHASTPVKEDC